MSATCPNTRPCAHVGATVLANELLAERTWRLRLSCLEEIEQYVLSWGTHATVIEPVVLRERLGQTAEALWQRYGGPWVLREARAVRRNRAAQ